MSKPVSTYELEHSNMWLSARSYAAARRPRKRLLLILIQILYVVCQIRLHHSQQINEGASSSNEPVMGHPRQRIPFDIRQWVYRDCKDCSYEDSNKRRFWDRAALQRAAGVANYEQMRPFLDKLNAGQPVTVVAFGDSITATHGGCYHRDTAHLRQHMQTLGSAYVRGHCTSVFKYRWASSFMHMINATWPHKDHILVNNGIPATSLSDFSTGVCLEYLLPAKADLLLLEHLPYLEHRDIALGIERLLHRLQLHFNSTLPPVVFLNMHRALHQGMNSFYSDERCIRNITLCPSECPSTFQALPEPESLADEAELRTHMLARYYGMASISHTGLISSMFRDGWPQRLNLSACELFATLYKDYVHPSDTGRLLLADVLVHYLAAAEAYFRAQARDPSFRPAMHAALLQPLRPMQPESLMVPRMKCYGSMQAAVQGMGSSEQVVPIHVVLAKGWQYIEMEGDKFKPGWVATEPGAVLQVQLDTTFTVQQQQGDGGDGAGEAAEAAGAAGKDAGDDYSTNVAHLGLSYLMSYEHMGVAAVTCVSGCSCSRGLIDGHDAVNHHSIPAFFKWTATPGQACVVQVEVLPDTASGEHKVKVMQVISSVWRNASSQVLGLLQEQHRAQGLYSA